MLLMMGIFFVLIALLPTFVLNRVFMVFFWRQDSAAGTIIGCHVSSYLFCVIVGALGFAAGGTPGASTQIGLAMISFFVPQFVWLMLDLNRFERRQRRERPAQRAASVQPVRAGSAAMEPVALLPPPEHYDFR